MNQLQPSELVKSLSLADHLFPVFQHQQNNSFPIQEGDEIPDWSPSINPLSASKPALTGEVDEEPVEQWLIERGTVAAVFKVKQPGFGQTDQGGSHD